MEIKEIEITVFDTRLKITSTFYVEKLSDNIFRMLENDIQNPRLTYGTEFETKYNIENKLEIVRITEQSKFITRRFLLSSEFKNLEFKLFGEEIIKNGGYWQTDFGGIATINLPKDSKLTFEEIFKNINYFPTEIKDEKPAKNIAQKSTFEEYPSKINNSIGTLFLLTLFYIPFIYFLLHWTVSLNIGQITFLGWTVFILCIACIGWVYVGLTNNNIIVGGKEIKIVNTVPFFKKQIVIELKNIKHITFKHEWTEIFESNPKFKKIIWLDFLAMIVFPYDYKWIKIEAEKDYKIYCFGLEMDYYDNPSPHFEELFYNLANRKINVCWTKCNDDYYLKMNEFAKNKKLQTD
jgi:hypothetical protein